MRLLLILPLILYLSLVFVNFDILWQESKINIFWLQTLSLPWIMINVLFIVGYTTILFLAFDWWISLLKLKNKKLEKELILTKAQLYDWQEKLIEKIKDFFEYKLNEKEIKLEEKLENILSQEESLLKKYNENILNKLEEIKQINKQTLQQVHKESEKALKKLELVDENFLDKFKQLVKR